MVTPLSLLQENGRGSLAQFQTNIKTKWRYLAWYTSDWETILAFNIIGWCWASNYKLTSVVLLIGGCCGVKCQGQACDLEVQICGGITWKLVLDTGLVVG